MAFFGSSTGLIYRQFSITIVSAMSLSALVALTFTPSLYATFLRPRVYRDLLPGSPVEADQIVGDLLVREGKARRSTPPLAADYAHPSVYQNRRLAR